MPDFERIFRALSAGGFGPAWEELLERLGMLPFSRNGLRGEKHQHLKSQKQKRKK